MKKFSYFLLLGAPGSGKGTQGDILAKHFNLLKISPGEIFRKIIKESPNDSISVELNALISSGNLVSTTLLNRIMMEYIAKNKANYSGILFDGYPRSLEQDLFLKTEIAPNGLDASIYLEISLDQLLDRLLYRQICDSCNAVFNSKHNPSNAGNECQYCGTVLKKRSDDNDERVVANRFKVFNEQSFPIIQEYQKQNKLITVNANKEIDVLSKELIEILQKNEYV